MWSQPPGAWEAELADFKMPSLGADMESGTLTKWLVRPGDRVERGDVVAVVDTEKSTIEVEIFQTGVVSELLVPEGVEVPVGTALARVATEATAGAEAGVKDAAAEAPPGQAGAAADTSRPGTLSPLVPTVVWPVVSPVVRRLAGRLGVDLTGLRGSGAGGRITRHDVEHAAGIPATVTGAASTPRGGPAVFARSSPLARRLASDRGVALASVRGSGPGGAITAADIDAATATAPRDAVATGAPTAGTVGDRRAAMRRAIGALMARSKREIPHYYLGTTADMSVATEWMARKNLELLIEDRLVLPALLIAATARAVAAVPEMNGFMIDGSFAPSTEVNVGVAISLRQGGLIAPAILHADLLDLTELMRSLRDLVSRARSANLRSSEMSDSTITVTNLGDLGVDSVFGVIYPPQVALVGFGRVAERPWAEHGMLGVRPSATVTLSADHRASDGHRGGRFLSEIVRLLEHPEEL